MIYTIQLNLHLDTEDVVCDSDIKDAIELELGNTALLVSDILVLDVND